MLNYIEVALYFVNISQKDNADFNKAVLKETLKEFCKGSLRFKCQEDIVSFADLNLFLNKLHHYDCSCPHSNYSIAREEFKNAVVEKFIAPYLSIGQWRNRKIIEGFLLLRQAGFALFELAGKSEEEELIHSVCVLIGFVSHMIGVISDQTERIVSPIITNNMFQYCIRKLLRETIFLQKSSKTDIGSNAFFQDQCDYRIININPLSKKNEKLNNNQNNIVVEIDETKPLLSSTPNKRPSNIANSVFIKIDETLTPSAESSNWSCSLI